jgi:hypothetical protein
VRYFFSILKNEDGDVAMILFPIFILILVFVALMAAEFTNYFVASQRVASLAREASNLVLAKCSDIIFQEQKVVGGSNKQTLDCIKKTPDESGSLKNQILDLGENSIKNFRDQGVVKIQIWTGSTGPTGSAVSTPAAPFFMANYTQSTNDASIGHLAEPTTRFATVADKNKLADKAVEFQRVVVAEVFYTYKTITPLPRITGFKMPTTIYEALLF